MARSGSSSMLASAAAASSRATATRRSCTASWRWSRATKPPTSATTSATPIRPTARRSRRLALAWWWPVRSASRPLLVARGLEPGLEELALSAERGGDA